MMDVEELEKNLDDRVRISNNDNNSGGRDGS